MGRLVCIITTLFYWLLMGGMLWGEVPMSWAKANHDHDHDHDEAMHGDHLGVGKKCSFTRYPNLCVESLMGSKSQFHDVHDIVSALVNKTIYETSFPSSYFSKFITNSQLEIKEESQRVLAVTDYCQELMNLSLKRLDQSLSYLKTSPGKNKEDIQTWLSAALTFQQTCKDSIKTLKNGSSNLMADQISQKMDYLSQLTSNSLALINRFIDPSSEDITSGIVNEKIHDFPKWVSGHGRKLLQAPVVKADAVVATDGTGNYKTVSEAINAAPGSRRFVIYVKAGVYKEKIQAKKDGITLIGDGKDSTVIVGDDSVAGGSSMPGSATFTVTGDGFIARDIGFQNTAGPNGEQALALNVASDHSVFFRCSIAGYQDTLYALANRQFYRDCDIYGTLDFIFGNAAAVFQNCNLVLRRPVGGLAVILASGRSDPGQNTGFVVQNSKITAGTDASPAKGKYNSYLGRPWKQYSRSVVMQTALDGVISPRGWVEWPGEGSYGKTLYFAEYLNSGPGSGLSGRVDWPGFHVIGENDAASFTVGQFISGSSWLPSTGVTFVSGL